MWKSEPSSRSRCTVAICARVAVAAVAAFTASKLRSEPAQIVNAEEERKGGHRIPDVKSAKYLGAKKIDAIEEIPGNETTARYYDTRNGTRFVTFSLPNHVGVERIYLINMDTDGKPPFEYALVNLKGNGKFTKVPMQKLDIPWILDYFKGE